MAAKKEPGFQERVPGGFWEAVLQTPQGTCLFKGDPGPRERGSALLMSTGACQEPVMRATLPMDVEKWKLACSHSRGPFKT